MRRLLLALAFAFPLAVAAAPAVRVFPDGPAVPASLLRISLQFAAPVPGPVLARLRLERDDGTTILQPLLEQELWSPDGKLLTVLLHPGRVKSGLVASATRGPVLGSGERIVLKLDGKTVKQWRVREADRQGAQPEAWRIGSVAAGTRTALIVELDDEVDRTAVALIAVLDQGMRRVAGSARLSTGARRWIFTPAAPWRRGSYRLAVHAQLEDPSGNRAQSRFELAGLSEQPDRQDVIREFQVEGGRR